ncbi:MAG: multidrug ABC transporter ATP-binding protein [Chloroflexi bacterium UTCFX4]|jgi:ABC-2 type transport system ATP-binding protein|nr:MAG: multidrug ABC transporter ATP-binding protein [Chloroflexi bacterium UTCFX4]
MIETQNLTKTFNQFTAVKNLNLSVARGEIFAFLGPNGAGKTTTMRMLACLVAPTSGSATIAGHRVGHDDDVIRGVIGILTEAPGLYEKLNAEQNLDFFARLYGLDAATRAKQIKRYLEILGLWERRAEPVGGFSKGMKQKLALARALLHEPQVVFLDEPTSALDPESAKVARDFIAELKSEGRTIFLCTHNLDEADRLADHVGVFKQHLIQVDTPENLRRKLYGQRVLFRVREFSDAQMDALAALAFARDIQRNGSAFSIALAAPDEMIPRVVNALVNAGAALLEVREERASLEEVYLDLVGKDGKSSTG